MSISCFISWDNDRTREFRADASRAHAPTVAKAAARARCPYNRRFLWVNAHDASEHTRPIADYQRLYSGARDRGNHQTRAGGGTAGLLPLLARPASFACPAFRSLPPTFRVARRRTELSNPRPPR